MRCGICKGAFTPHHYMSKYCSDECARHASNERSRRYREANPEKIRIMSREGGRRFRARNPGYITKKCIQWRRRNPERSRLIIRVNHWKNKAKYADNEYDYEKAVAMRDAYRMELNEVPING